MKDFTKQVGLVTLQGKFTLLLMNIDISILLIEMRSIAQAEFQLRTNVKVEMTGSLKNGVSVLLCFIFFLLFFVTKLA